MTGSVRSIAAVALALLGFASPAPAARAGDFYATGVFTNVGVHGNRFELSFDGVANPGGAFTGIGLGKRVQNGGRQYGDIVMDFGGGDTLAFFAESFYDPATGILSGTYVVTGGTGALAYASGSGTCSFLGQPVGGTGPFEFEGTLWY